METQKIYIRLLEGLETFVPVTATLLANGHYKLGENPYLDLAEDISSIWEFFPGDIVECKWHNDLLVASDLIDFDFPNRISHSIIFQIVKSNGEVSPIKFIEYTEVLDDLCSHTEIIQTKHPVVRVWLDKYCFQNKK